MANLLYLVHRMPYPPDKGDKVRSYHLLKHLLARNRVFLGTFIDDPADEQHVDTLRAMCAGLCAIRLRPRRARLASLSGLLSGEALTLHYYRDAELRRWVGCTLASEPIDAAVVFSSSMAQYAEGLGSLPVFVDFVDVDSAKWTAYAHKHAWPMSWLYRREGSKLLAYERAVAAFARRSFFSTANETRLFLEKAPEFARAVEPVSNGVDAHFYAPAVDRASPYAAGEEVPVFTGAMDYWPNIDAVTWFANDVLPQLRRRRPNLRFYIVGRAPTGAVQALASEAVIVTGTVPDVRPYLQHAAVGVAPLRLARGVQNKILEAMAMGRAVVAASSCVEALEVCRGTEVVSAERAADYVREIEQLLDVPAAAHALGAAGRARVLESYTWAAHMAVFDRQLAALPDLAAA
jgi:sugar transferase (PEP-CTERM/EpsH1 system associated)